MVSKQTITKRWIKNSLSIIIIVMLILTIIFAISMSNFYYGGAMQSLVSRAVTLSDILTKTLEDTTLNFNKEVKKIIENSSEKDMFELSAINTNGEVVISSSGFSYEGQTVMPDYQDALVNPNGLGSYTGVIDNGEKIMAVTMLIPQINSEYSAVRYVVSTRNIDELLILYTLLFIVIAVSIIGVVIISGVYFIKSIVIPVRQVGVAARKFATGDMSVRVEKKIDDELGELCDVINYMADEISQSEQIKNEFISSVSHELRTPLTAIKGWSETINTMDLEKVDNDTLQKGMKVITKETERLAIMVEELLDFSRMQGGSFSLNRAKVDVLAEVGDAVLIYTEKARRDEISLTYYEPETVPVIMADGNRLRQVFINIIDNALKYCDPFDKISVSVNDKMGYIYVVVKDTGCGISKEDLPKIKTKFFKANVTRRGSGIGLAVANEIITMHGGDIFIESELNIGTTVTVRLPIKNNMVK